MKALIKKCSLSGDQRVLLKRLKSHLRAQALEKFSSMELPLELSMAMDQNPHRFDFLVVVDFEATCEEVNPPDHLFEIIEFPALLFSVKDRVVVSTCAHTHTHTIEVDPHLLPFQVDQFHMHCKPLHRPQLSAFCQRLTGISQVCVLASPRGGLFTAPECGTGVLCCLVCSNS